MTPSNPESAGIFISYRREDAAYPAGWLYDHLAHHYGEDRIFKDVDSIRLGDDFVEHVNAAVGSCAVLLAVIGKQWLTLTDEEGRRRLDDPTDFVRLEIETALTRDVRVIPVLVNGARMPRAAELPTSMEKLARRQALELSPNHFNSDSSHLLKALDATFTRVGRRLRRSRIAVITIAVIGILATGIAAVTTLSSPHHSDSAHHESGTAPSQQPTNLRRYSPIRTLTDPAVGSRNYGGDGAYAVAFSPDGKTLAVGDNNGRTYLWNPATGTLNATLTNPNAHLSAGSVVISPDGQRLAVAGAGKAIYIWDVTTRTLSASVPHPNDGCCTTVPVAFSPDGYILAVGSGGGRTYLLDGFTSKILATLTTTLTVGGPNGVFALAFSPDGRTLAVGGVNQGTCLWNVATRKQTACIPDPSNQGVASVAFSPDGRMLATGDGNGKTYLWNVSTRSLSATLTVPGKGERSIESLAFSPVKQTIAVADDDGNTYLWDIATGNITAILAEPAGSPFYLAFSPDGSTLATVTPYGSTYLWKVT